MPTDEEPLVSAVLPTYNRIQHVERAIDSVVEQTYDRLELVVVDDCSDVPVRENVDHGPLEDLERYEFVRHDENRGGSAARNTGMEVASGDYVALLDDDDEWKPEKIARQVKRLQESDAGVVFTGGRMVDGDGELYTMYRPPETVPSRPELTKNLLCRNFVGGCSVVMVDAELVEEVGTFDERFPSWQDQEWYVRLSRHSDFVSIPDPLVEYRVAAPHSVSENVEAKRTETYPLFVEKFEALARSYGPLFHRKMLAWAAFRVGKALLSADRAAEARTLLGRAVTLYPFEPEFYPYLVPSLGGQTGVNAARTLKRALD